MDKVKQLNNFTLYDDNALGLSLRRATSTANLRIMLQPALMTALKPKSVGMPPGVAMMIPTADKEVNGYANNVDTSFSHLGASRTGQVKDG